MTAELIDGRRISEEVKESLKPRVGALKEKDVTPALATLVVGENPPSQLYVKLKTKAAKEVGLNAVVSRLPADVSEIEIIELIKKLNKDPRVDGILVQLPLPSHISKKTVLEAVSPAKDVDGFHPINQGKIVFGDELMAPATPKGVVKLIESVTGLKGREVAVVSHSTVVGKPLTLMLLNRDATVTVCHEYTKDLASHTSKADVIVSAAGVPKLIKADMVKEGAVVIDVGVAKTVDGVCGDVDFDAVKEKASYITPVPGGVGPMTVAMVIENTVNAAEKIHF